MAALSKILRSQGGGRVAFWCPGCDGPHSLPVRPDHSPSWDWNGNAEAPTLSPSILSRLTYSSGREDICHFFVRAGNIEFLGDCTHELAGKIVAIPEWPADFHDGDSD